MIRKIFLLSLLVLGPTRCSKEGVSFVWKDLDNGAQYAQYNGKLFGNPQCISVFRCPTAKFTIDIVNDPGLREPKQADMPAAVNPDAPATTVSGFAERYDAIAAINGSFFNTKTLYPSTYVRDEDEQEGADYYYDSVRINGGVFVKDGKIQIKYFDSPDYNPKFTSFKDVLASGPVLITNGRVMSGWPDDDSFNECHPRSAVAIGGGYTYFIVVDGRFLLNSVGMTMGELTELCRLMGCTDAINLDGGGSSALWVKPMGVISHPCDNKLWNHGGERVVPNAIVVR